MNSDSSMMPLWPIGTLVGWICCCVVSVLGLVISYGENEPPRTPEFPPTQLVEAQLAPEPLPAPRPQALAVPPPDAVPPASLPPEAPPPPPSVPAPPAMVAVAPPSPAISFAVPVAGFTHVVDVNSAGFSGSSASVPLVSGGGSGGATSQAPPAPRAPPAEPSVVHLSMGEGQGSAIRPDYPREAILAQEEGTVGVRFTVGEDGRVTSVDITLPSRWPLLNQAATRAVREATFPPGPRRMFDIPIEFQLNR